MQLELDSDRVNRLFDATTSEFGDFLRQGMRFYHETPEIADLIGQAQRALALEKKSI
jgi:hypothetical protein